MMDAPDYREIKEGVGWAKGEMAKHYAAGRASDVEQSILLTDPQRRPEAIEIIDRLIMDARGEAEFSMPSPADEMLTKLATAHARSNNPQHVERKERRERLRPYVAEVLETKPNAGAAELVRLLGKRQAFGKAFPEARRTLEADAAALLKEIRQT